jgi:hypothetical protein
MSHTKTRTMTAHVSAGPLCLIVTLTMPSPHGITSDIVQVWYDVPERRWKAYASPARFGLGLSAQELFEKIISCVRELRRELEETTP